MIRSSIRIETCKVKLKNIETEVNKEKMITKTEQNLSIALSTQFGDNDVTKEINIPEF